MGHILLKNIITNGKPAEILISDGVIKRINYNLSEAIDTQNLSDIEIMDCGGKEVIPSFVNMHTHAAMTLLRGVQEDVSFHKWISGIWSLEKNVDADFVYHGTKVAALEMIKTGTTVFNDQYWYPEQARKAAIEMGIRPVISYDFLDGHNEKKAEIQRDECIKFYEETMGWNDRTILNLSVHAIYTVSESSIVFAKEFAEKHNLGIHIHVSETRKEVEDCKAAHGSLSPVEYLDELGVLNNKTIAAHTLWLSDKDVEILGMRGVNCVHNINSNTKLSSGYRFRYNELRDAGANVCIGTDGCASSNNLDILEAMKTSALFQKAWRDDPTAMPIEELFRTATINGAKALGINAGKVEEGCDAELLIVDTDNSFFLSPAPFLSNFIYSAHSDCIDSVISGGKFVMKNRMIYGEKEILNEAKKLIINK